MKKLLAFMAFLMLISACSDDGTSISLCSCEPDEYCVDDVCYPTDSSIIPAPEE